MSLEDSPLSPEPASASDAVAVPNKAADFTPHVTDATASSIEQIQQILAEPSPAKKEPFLKRLFGGIDHDVKGVLSDIHNWLTIEKPVIKQSSPGQHARWKNDTGNQVVDALQMLTPSTLQDLVQLVKTAEAQNCKVRAVGSGHSFSDVIQTHDFLVSTDKLNQWLPIDTTLFKEGVDSKFLVEVQGGIKIQQLNQELDNRGLALINMGGYDGQSIAGATSTGTHGSGISFGPLASFYKSMVLVAGGGAQYRIEPTQGITDPVKHGAQHPDIQLIQDDDWFNTVSVSMGCTGIIYSVILEVMPAYWLEEVRTLSNWEQVKALLIEGKVFTANRHFEVLINPYSFNGTHTCLITTRNPRPIVGVPPPQKDKRNFFSQLFGLIPGMVDIIDFLLLNFPQLFPKIIENALGALKDNSYINKSYNVLNIGTENNLSAYSSELAFPMEGNKYIDAVEKIFEEADKMKTLGNVYHTSPFSLRFVKAAGAYLAMMNGRDTCMIEIPVANGSFGGFQLLERYEQSLLPFSMRPHWGMINYLTGSHDLIKGLYPNYESWLAVYKKLNAKATFDNRFSYRCGFADYPG